MSKELKLEHLRHSLAHLLAAAVLDIYPEAKPTIGPAIENGFYYDFDFSAKGGNADKRRTDADGRGISEKDLPRIEKMMKKILPKWQSFKKIEVSADDAKYFFSNNAFKLEVINELAEKKESITFYYSGLEKNAPTKTQILDSKFLISDSGFVDLCRGGHVENPAKEIDPESFKLDRVAGAYWRGDEKNKMLTRIYGLAFSSKKELNDYVAMREEAKKRDHKKIGKELDLFTFSDLVGAGLPLWTPKGTILRDLLDDFVWDLRRQYGYERVDIPHIAKADLYKKSGHADKFTDDLFKITTREKHVFVMKPMNCPHHIEIFARKTWSYRELPARYATTTKVYRDEQTGELAGLSRVRSITQDDAHVFCRMKDVKEEAEKIWNIITKFYGTFGFELSPRLSLHDPKSMNKYLGGAETWQKAENELRELVKSKGSTVTEAPGEAAFYGPKIDFMAKDSIGREWQVATIQLDMNLPEQFDLSCTNEKGVRERIVMLHAAIMGSLERFLGILIEHYGGAFPFWLSPVQVKVLPIGLNHLPFARKIFAKLKVAGIRAELLGSDENLGKKVRSAKVEKIPYWLVIGDKEVEVGKVTLESREKGNLGQIDPKELLEKFLEENN